jgi:hypothetical protein
MTRHLRALLPPVDWLGKYQLSWLRSDLAAGVTLAAGGTEHKQDIPDNRSDN